MKGHIQSGVYIILIVLLLFTQGAFAANIALQKVGNHTIKTTVIHRGYPANKGRTASHSFQVDQLIYSEPQDSSCSDHNMYTCYGAGHCCMQGDGQWYANCHDCCNGTYQCPPNSNMATHCKCTLP